MNQRLTLSDDRRRRLDQMQAKAIDEDIKREMQELPIGDDAWPMSPFSRVHDDERRAAGDDLDGEIWVNDIYQVKITPVPCSSPAMLHLNIKRHDMESVHDWRDLQAIKNILVGSENEGFEMYPAESRKQDNCNKYHLYVFKEASDKINVGACYRMVSNNGLGLPGKPFQKQRPYQGLGW
jgi:hypothetical protein